jgi:hypothetical protein
MRDAQTPHVGLGGDGSDQTVVSDPPAFGLAPITGTEEIFDDPAADAPRADATADSTADSTLDRDLPVTDDAPTGQRRAALPDGEEEETRLDIGVSPTPTPTPERGRSPSSADDDSDAEDMLEAPTRRRRGERMPDARAAESPRPAVSALAPRRPSRRTPHAGVPLLGGAGGPSTPVAPQRAPSPAPVAVAAQPTVPQLAARPASPSAPPMLPLEPPVDTPAPFRPPTPPAPGPAPGTGRVPRLTPAADIGAPGGGNAPPPDLAPLAQPYPPPPELSLDEGSLGVGRLAPSRRGLLLWIGGGALVALVLALVVAITTSGGPTAPTSATVEVISIPPGATVRVDGAALPGTTPLKWTDARPGKTYALIVEAPKHEPWRGEAAIPPNGTEVKVIASLRAIVGTLRVTSDPTGAEVFLDGRSIGRTPVELPGLDPFVESAVEVRLRGHKPDRKPVVWPADRKASLHFELTPAR